ncbi:HNH endonuclease signature motif containing protein [Prauserella muralis]|uniref:Uncharacterized protein n=1 Tax=Prauserella muralis TaxID=588067 RepID=A0A2V4ANN5_9PSEU|nr:HNH endonuclease signature motif containing protein [Prauserella muralis]PXY22187.1 hypothetical protein BAY60_20055 [Prauserella muralis]TWE27796.1 uncharacterized protein DUF222 [Prauserella muralis]
MGETRISQRAQSLDKIASLQRQLGRISAALYRRLNTYLEVVGDPADAAQELALVLAVSVPHARRELAVAEALARRLPETFAALRAGEIDAYKARKVVEPTACLTDEQARAVDRGLVGRLEGKTPVNVRRAVQRVVHKVDPAGAAARAMRRRADRRVELRHRDEAMATVAAELPAEVASAVYARIDRAARGLRCKRESRSLDQLRADVLTDLVLGGQCGTEATKAEIFVYIDFRTLAQLNNDPAELAGHGSIPAWLARQIAHDPSSVWRRIVTDPLTGRPVDVGRQRYRPPVVTGEFVRVRDRECRFPGCQRPAQFGDVDHHRPWGKHGGTNHRELIGYCRRHHRLKDKPGWDYGLDGGTGRLTVTTPGGRTYTSDPPPLHDPPPG